MYQDTNSYAYGVLWVAEGVPYLVETKQKVAEGVLFSPNNATWFSSGKFRHSIIDKQIDKHSR